MSGRVVFLLEEPSMKAFLQEYLPWLVPGWQAGRDFLLVPHEGKSDLDRSITTKLRAWREPGVRFVIVRDNDGADCLAVKARLRASCNTAERLALIRLICQELESWYLGDGAALAAAYPQRRKEVQKLVKRFPDPDACLKPSRELERGIPEFGKMDAARRLGATLDAQCNGSASLRAFAAGVAALVQTGSERP